MTQQNAPKDLPPLSAEQLDRLQAISSDLSNLQLAWASGYLWNKASHSIPIDYTASQQVITVLSASQTGNARRLAVQLYEDLLAAQLSVVIINAGDYKFKQIAQEKWLLIVTSTQGDGDPPEEAIALYKYLFSKKAPVLNNIQFAIFGLGDSSYTYFAKIGKDFDSRLAELGAQRLYDRVDADVDYQEKADIWRREIVKILQTKLVTVNAKQQLSVINNRIEVKNNLYTKEEPFTAHLVVKQKITSRSSKKDIRHLEIDIAGSGLNYQPGDALGVWYENDPVLISEILELLGLTGNELVQVKEKNIPLNEALQKHYELTNNTAEIVKSYAYITRNSSLLALVDDQQQLKQFAFSTPFIDMIQRIPVELHPKQLLTLLRPLMPRLYSIASSQAEVGDEVHLTVSVVRYEIDGKIRTGGASSYLAYRLQESEPIRVFIEHNDNFRLPNNPNTAIIMIGSGTGIAPFRGFMQQREATTAKGKNWLFFGNQHLTDDFLYQVEWQRYIKNGLLNKIDVAWSQDQNKKIYVQDRLLEKGIELWNWIQDGAHIYVCGNANLMARDVEKALVKLIAIHGRMDYEQADEFLSELRIARRFQRDTY
ncbi:NADPH-dependent assimilatory sulfite reductase flavoprotein subunit [Candidatus Palibaumannia cicadellinicola]|uniref:Sulfite reductase [NADPH] flavoprotein alpha-component n=1 Tax=Baumannia cicadellinicola subsp. Homalodisca coagulata TaxID=374463 RepID=CYSJ_BAUCH|nr:NADPH-dependent assimilatory sulfite reductase flavoprotein subunit [Candidatus Baumannia cicadellinicola]Q1LTP1.1 RecName: Full=Sulfite reductase [NADPH] flavoprotein alpha-component; Short=SiR-FP [Baumannia cicadellinicola str. Hc (Homalodisca coagulata)]ABF14003.1 sulfite reductase [NADPH] flavoprotein, alpha chain [Baumannia cicadellinicola str. Hc (Homalodisca coagulata)]MCJ7462344.1 NADPH-dependent assimilatory sulfite reductase flavoprotein subunit [Candidatus Baumannia cicadellinicola